MEQNNSIRYGGFWVRFLAYMLDGLILLVPTLLVEFLERSVWISSFYSFLIGFLIGWAYFAGLHSSKWQATVGKKVLRLKVVDYSRNRISFGRATGRYFASYLSGLILCIGYFMVGWTKRKQGLHDFIAQTLVIKEIDS